MKKVLSVLMVTIMLFSIVMFPVSADNGEISVYLDGQKIEFDVPPQIVNGRTMVPMRKIFEELGATVDWDNMSRTAIGKKDNTVVKITINDKKMQINDNTIYLDVPAQLIDGKTMVPVRAISESFYCDVLWEQESKRVSINTMNESDSTDAISDKKEIHVGYDFITLLDSNNNLYGWGNNDEGQLILENAKYNKPTKIASNIKKVQCGLKHTLVLTVDGKVYCYGNNTYSQHGGKNPGEPILEDIIDIASANNHCIALDTNGTVFCWGENQFGIDTKEKISTPVELLTKVKKIFTMQKLCMYILEDGTLYATGDDMNLYKCRTQKSSKFFSHNIKKAITYVDEQEMDIALNLVNKNISDVDADGEIIIAKTSEEEIILYYAHKYSKLIDECGVNIPYLNWHKSNDGEMWINREDSSLYINSTIVGYTITPKYPYIEDVESAKHLESGAYVAVLKDGSVWTFGKNDNGTLGNASSNNTAYPNKIIDSEMPLEETLDIQLVSTGMFTDGYTLLVKFVNKAGEIVKPTGSIHVKIYNDFDTLYTGTVYVYNKSYNKDNSAEIIIQSSKIKKSSSETGNVDIVFEKAFCETMCSGIAEELPVYREESSNSGKTVYVTPSGSRYHFDATCGGKNSYGISLKGARDAGYSACQKCAR